MFQSYSYSIIYIVVILILFYLAYEEGRWRSVSVIHRNRLINIGVFLLILFFGLRGFVHTDFQNYYPWFQELPLLEDLGVDSLVAYEPGFVLLSSVSKTIIPNYFFWIFVCSLIDFLLLKKIFREYSTNVCLSFAIYLAVGAIIMEFNLMRNTKAILILIIATKYVRERKFGRYILCVLMATAFHLMSVIFLPLYFVLNRRLSKSVLLAIFFFCLVVLLFQVKFLFIILWPITEFLGGEYAAMAEYYYASGMLDSSYGVTLGLLERVISFCLVFYYYDRWADKTGNKYVFSNMVVMYFMCFSLFAEMAVLLERFAYFFALSYCIFYPNLFQVIKRNTHKVVLACYITVLFTLKLAQQTQPIICRYDNVLFGIESFDSRLRILDSYNANVQ